MEALLTVLLNHKKFTIYINTQAGSSQAFTGGQVPRIREFVDWQ